MAHASFSVNEQRGIAMNLRFEEEKKHEQRMQFLKEAGAKGYRFMPLNELLTWSEVVCCCLNKNTVLLLISQAI